MNENEMKELRKSMINSQTDMVLKSLSTILDMLDGNEHFVTDNRNDSKDYLGDSTLKDDYELACNDLSEAKSCVRMAIKRLKDAKRDLNRKGDKV